MANNRKFKSPKARKFEDLNVYKQARMLTNKVYEITRRSGFSKDYSLVDQVRRASVSVMSNIAEGFERGSNTEFIQFLYIAKGSCGEARSQLTIAYDQKYVGEDDYKNLVERCVQVSVMLANFIGYLRGSGFRGAKFKKIPRKSMAEELDEMLEEIKRKHKQR